MAYEIVGKTDGQHIAGADLSGDQFRFVVIDANQQVQLAGAGDDAYGVLQNKPKLGESCTIWLVGSVSKVVAGAAIGLPSKVASDASGRAVAAGAGDEVLGTLLTPAAAAGEIVSVRIDKSGTA